jgi:hypothetical protein
MSNKKAFEMSFNWMFALIAGAIILFAAVYATTKFIDTGKTTLYTESASKISTLLDPMETGLASGKSAEINFDKEAITYHSCSSEFKPFGKSTISFTESKSIGKQSENALNEINIYNKFIFANDSVSGKNLYLFSKPINIPFKVADLIMISSEEYCFYQAPNEIINEVNGLSLKNIKIIENLKNCTGIKVCFGTKDSKCDVFVSGMCEGLNCESKYDYGKVIKNGKTLYYYEGLMYGAIVSSAQIYECNLKRLMNKLNELTTVYKDKIKVIQSENCDSDMQADLNILAGYASNFKSSEDLFQISQKAKDIDSKNKFALCSVY